MSNIGGTHETSRFVTIDREFAEKLRSKFACPVFLLDELGIRRRFRELKDAAQFQYANSAVAVSYKMNPTRAMNFQSLVR